MLFYFPEHGLIGNLLGWTLLVVMNIVVYFIIRPLMYNYFNKESEVVDSRNDNLSKEYWNEEL